MKVGGRPCYIHDILASFFMIELSKYKLNHRISTIRVESQQELLSALHSSFSASIAGLADNYFCTSDSEWERYIYAGPFGECLPTERRTFFFFLQAVRHLQIHLYILHLKEDWNLAFSSSTCRRLYAWSLTLNFLDHSRTEQTTPTADTNQQDSREQNTRGFILPTQLQIDLLIFICDRAFECLTNPGGKDGTQ